MSKHWILSKMFWLGMMPALFIAWAWVDSGQVGRRWAIPAGEHVLEVGHVSGRLVFLRQHLGPIEGDFRVVIEKFPSSTGRQAELKIGFLDFAVPVGISDRRDNYGGGYIEAETAHWFLLLSYLIFWIGVWWLRMRRFKAVIGDECR